MKISVSQAMRDQGIAAVSAGHEEWLATVRAHAWAIARARGAVSINDLRPVFDLPPGAHHNFVPNGLTQVVHPQGHARTVRTYALTTTGLNLSSVLE